MMVFGNADVFPAREKVPVKVRGIQADVREARAAVNENESDAPAKNVF